MQLPKGNTLLHLGMPWKLSKTSGRVRSFAPDAGQDNRRILGDLLGLSDMEIDRLDAAGVVDSISKPRFSNSIIDRLTASHILGI